MSKSVRGASLVVVVALVGCGGPAAGSEPAAPPAAAAAVEAGPAARCLALANTKYEKTPNEPDAVTVKHVLVKHVDSKNPREGVTRTREDACLRALAARDEMLAGASFDDVVAKYSDEPGAEGRRGVLGEVSRADVVPAFGDAAFALERAQMSDVVETPHGFHLIVRTE